MVLRPNGKETVARFDIHNQQQWHELAWKSQFNARVLSQNLQISTRQLRRYTEKVFGMSTQRWLNTQRMEAAAAMLRERRSAKFVAFELGFKQLAHFSREFKTHHGLSPRGFLTRTDLEVRNSFSADNEPAYRKPLLGASSSFAPMVPNRQT
jgi:AraC-like DNA-binding protein